jgi:hypothetical protein
VRLYNLIHSKEGKKEGRKERRKEGRKEATYYLLPTTYYLLPTTYYLLPTSTHDTIDMNATAGKRKATAGTPASSKKAKAASSKKPKKPTKTKVNQPASTMGSGEMDALIKEYYLPKDHAQYRTEIAVKDVLNTPVDGRTLSIERVNTAVAKLTLFGGWSIVRPFFLKAGDMTQHDGAHRRAAVQHMIANKTKGINGKIIFTENSMLPCVVIREDTPDTLLAQWRMMINACDEGGMATSDLDNLNTLMKGIKKSPDSSPTLFLPP